MIFFWSVKLWLFTLQEYIAGSPLVISSVVRPFVRYPKSPIFLPFLVQYTIGGGFPTSDLHSQKETECFLEHFNWATGWTKGKTINKYDSFWRHENIQNENVCCQVMNQDVCESEAVPCLEFVKNKNTMSNLMIFLVQLRIYALLSNDWLHARVILAQFSNITSMVNL